MRVAVVILLALAAHTVVSQSLNRCMPFFSTEKLGYDMVGLDTANKGQNYQVPININDPAMPTITKGDVYFKVCGDVESVPAGCTKVPGATAYLVTGTVCRPLNTLMSKVEQNLVRNSMSSVIGVSVGYKGANVSTIPMNVLYEVFCDKNIKDNFKWTAQVSINYIVLTTTAAQGCSYGISDILDIFQNNKIITFAVFLTIGLLFCFFGRHSYRWTLLLCGFLVGFLLVAGVCYSMGMFVQATDKTKYVILGIAAVTGLIIGFLLFYFEQTTVSVICGVLTVLIVKALLSLFFPTLVLSTYVELAVLVVAGIIGGALGSYFKE